MHRTARQINTMTKTGVEKQPRNAILLSAWQMKLQELLRWEQTASMSSSVSLSWRIFYEERHLGAYFLKEWFCLLYEGRIFDAVLGCYACARRSLEKHLSSTSLRLNEGRPARGLTYAFKSKLRGLKGQQVSFVSICIRLALQKSHERKASRASKIGCVILRFCNRGNPILTH